MNWRTAIEAVGILLLTSSLVFVGYELYQNRQIAIADRLTAAVEVEASIKELLSAHASIWRRGCVGEQLTPDEQSVYNQLYWVIQYRKFTLWNISKTSVRQAPSDMIVDSFARSIAMYPGFRATYKKYDRIRRQGDNTIYIGTVVEEFISLVDEAADKYPAHESDTDATFCGL